MATLRTGEKGERNHIESSAEKRKMSLPLLITMKVFLFWQKGSMSSRGMAVSSGGNSAASLMGSGIPPSSWGSALGPSSSSSSSQRACQYKNNQCQPYYYARCLGLYVHINIIISDTKYIRKCSVAWQHGSMVVKVLYTIR